MKNLYLLALIAIISVTVIGCGSTNQLTLSTTEPALVTISQDVKRIGLINRSVPSEQNTKIDQIDKILSIEGAELDQEGSMVALQALQNALLDYGIAEEVVIIDPSELTNKGLSILPAMLSWEIIDSLCTQNEVDAIFSLSFFDTDTKVDYRTSSMLLPNDFGVKIAVPAHELTLHTLIKNGWRIYDPIQRVVADEFLCNDQVVSVGKGINPVKAYEAIVGRKEAVVIHSSNMASAYASRLLPSRRRIARDYYVKGTQNFVVAKRRAQTGDWQGAADLWDKEINNSDSKIAGRAYYNMAIINEINGDLESAMDWASKAYTDFDNKLALRYLESLRYRSAQNEQLQR